MSLLVEFKYSPFGDPFSSEDSLTEVTEISSKGFNYLQFCSLIGQFVLHYGYVNVRMHYVVDKLHRENK